LLFNRHDIGSITLHKFTGIGDGRYLNEEICHLINTDERFSEVKTNIKEIDTLIVDEIYMISSKVLGQIQFICQKVRCKDELFGNLQVILVGDFYQLPPVPSELVGDTGKHCFKLPWFDQCFPHKVNLNIVHRQSDSDLTSYINRLEKGCVSETDVGLLNSLSRTVENEDKFIHLFARKFDVDMYNYTKIQNLPGDTVIFKSKDEGSTYYLDKLLVPKNIGLKIACPVILLKNLSNELVNGLRGTVINLKKDCVDVAFHIGEKTITCNITPCPFTTNLVFIQIFFIFPNFLQ
jgi:ATP-dependent DNA helicase PIF1